MTSPAELSKLIGSIYDAGMDPARWPYVLDGIACAPDSGHAALILISDPERDAIASEDALMSLYGLTPAKVRIAVRLGQGESLAAVADSLGVLTSTARTHLHHAFAKTSTRRQSELARLVEQAAMLARRPQDERPDPSPTRRIE